MPWRKIHFAKTIQKCNILRNESKLKLIETNRQHLSELKWSKIGLTMLNQCIGNATKNKTKQKARSGNFRFMEINRLIQDLLHNFHNLASSSGIRYWGMVAAAATNATIIAMAMQTRITHSMHFYALRCQLNFVRHETCIFIAFSGCIRMPAVKQTRRSTGIVSVIVAI